MMERYDLVVIGGGPGGYHAAERAAHHGFSVLLIEKDTLGGVCLNAGCIPSKTLLNSSKRYDMTRHGSAYGVKTDGVHYAPEEVLKRKNQVVDALVKGVGYTLKTQGVTVIKDHARITGMHGHAVKIALSDTEILAKRLILATGSVPFLPGIEGLENPHVMTSKVILDLDVVPHKLVIIGGGVIGVEMATHFSRIGSDVTILEMLPTLGGPLDQDVEKTLRQMLDKQGVKCLTEAKVVRIDETTITYEHYGKTHELPHDRVLLSAGRRPMTEELGVKSIGLEVSLQGAIVTDDRCQTNVKHTYAIGDVNGKSMLAHTAYREAEVCINTIMGKKDRVDYNTIPAVIYTSPEIAVVGRTRSQALEEGYDVIEKVLPMVYSGRHLAESASKEGFVKLVLNRQNNTLLGAHIVAAHASEMILYLTAMMDLVIDAEQMTRFVYPHPSYGELIKDTLFFGKES
ncbi:MAG: dihydrolipoyl dehydrogenase [Acholeplasmataceae bacterium]|nr:dihydrolipoyl dehydrogenase [Acholeplasmataceae bacterium]